jgi:hypothetical protein
VRRNLTWVLLTACAWFVLSVVVNSITGRILHPFESLSVSSGYWLAAPSEWLFSLTSGAAAYGLIRLSRRYLGTPRASWLGILLVEVVAIAVNSRGLWWSSAWAQQMPGFVFAYLPLALIPVLGAWLALRHRGSMVAGPDPMPAAPEGPRA